MTKLATRITGEHSTDRADELQAGASNPVPPGVPAMAIFISVNPKEEGWLTYVERSEMFFVVNNVPEDKKAASLLILMGANMYALLKSLTTLTKPTEMPFKDIVEVMGRHPLVIA